MGAEVVCTACCGMISQEKALFEGSGQPVAMEPSSKSTMRPQYHAMSIQMHQGPGVFLGDSLHPGAQLLHPIQKFFFLMLYLAHQPRFGLLLNQQINMQESSRQQKTSTFSTLKIVQLESSMYCVHFLRGGSTIATLPTKTSRQASVLKGEWDTEGPSVKTLKSLSHRPQVQTREQFPISRNHSHISYSQPYPFVVQRNRRQESYQFADCTKSIQNFFRTTCGQNA